MTGPAAPNDMLIIDVTRLVWRVWSGRLPTGIDRVCLAYVKHFRARAVAAVQRRGVRFVLGEGDSHALFDLLVAGGPGFRRALVRRLPGALVRAAVARRRRGGVYLNIGHTGLDAAALGAWIRRRGWRAVFMVHDLIPIETPRYCRPGEAERHVRRMTHAVVAATTSGGGLIANSDGTRDAIDRFTTAHRLAAPPIVTAWLAPHPLPPGPPTVRTRPYFLAIGTIEARKNHVLLLRLWQRLVARLGAAAPDLLVVGQRGWEAAEAFALLDAAQGDGHVVELGRCDDATLAGLIRGARAVLMPSFAEGFGLPVVEALALGTPVIASDLAVFAEIGGGIPTLLPPDDLAAWEAAVVGFCGDAPERIRQIAALPGYRASDWRGHFRIVEAWLARLA